jgi:hypothetical protein
MTLFDFASVALLIVFVGLNWVLPRSLGLLGVLLVHVGLVVCYFVLAAVSMSIGRYEYDGFLSAVGLALQAVALNCLLLPIALTALWRHALAHNHAMQMDSRATSSVMDNPQAASH